MGNARMLLNELSSIELSKDKYQSIIKMRGLINTIKSAINQGISGSILIPEEIDFNNIELSKGYYIYHWRNEIKANPDLRSEYQLFLSILNKSEVICTNDIQEGDFILNNGDKSQSLLKCYKEQHIALSFLSKKFSESTIVGLHCFLDIDANYITEDATIYHLSTPEHVLEVEIRDIIDYLNRQDALNIRHNIELWEKKEILFPTLVFCDNVKKQILKVERILLVESIKKILILEHYFSSWDWKGFDYRDLPNTSPESESTLRTYEKQHTFRTPFGKTIIVSYHIKGAAYNNRIYFHIDYEREKIIICSIGEHLPCVTYG
ncbi:hypothetical protein QPK24_23255 [Paenibacillus polygoni]|uniref:Uncharacterized protein n=1 Tax=Paenibacillus polygoni TaxID=3050112 RepID=A0ABY8X7P1_9BACL|nr:hypothetical protein [Paenibacillus polygoni]WIV19195.1 hypothetical protein QPK24_23255 [Paenibacillus polygoni]